MTVPGDAIAALFALGEEASASNLGQITITGALGTGIEGVIGNTNLTNEGVISITSDESVGIAGLGDGHQISNSGLIEMEGAFSRGIISRGLNLEIDNAGHITTAGELAFGITVGLSNTFRTSEDGQIVNSGVIETVGDGAAGVIMAGDGHHLTNSGLITTDGGAFDSDTLNVVMSAASVVVSGDDALVQNTRTGVIRSENADSAAIELNVLERDGLSNAATSATLENSGLIEGAVAILGGDGEETVINRGRIVGDVNLGGGADTFVAARGGRVAGDLVLGDGDDVVIIENGSGTTAIADFAGAGVADGDRIDVSVFFSTIDELKAESVQSGTDVVVALDQNDTLVIENVQLSTLNSGDFIFV